MRGVPFHTCATLDPIYEANPDWTMNEVVAVARAEAAELLKGLQEERAKRIERGDIPSWRRSRRAPISADDAQSTLLSEIDLNG